MEEFMDIKKLLGMRIREYRTKRNLTQYKLAEIIGIDGKHLSSIELGKNMPNPQVIFKLSQVLNIEVKDLFEFYHLQEPKDLKEDIKKLVDNLGETQLRQTYQYIRTFVL